MRDVNPQAIDTLTMEESAQQRHNSQGYTCSLCHCDERPTLSTGCPRRLSQPRSAVTAFKGKKDTLSNFYPYVLRIYGQTFKLSEHAYQFRKARYFGREDIANEISRVYSACEAIRVAKILPKGGGWEATRVDVMRHIIKPKAATVSKYRAELLAAKETIVEAVHGDLYWSCGLSKEDARWAETRDWPGENTMGGLHTELRESLKTSELKL